MERQYEIVFLDAATLGDTGLEEIERFGNLTRYETSTADEALERVRDCEILIVNKVVVDRRLLDAAPKLRLVCEAATGVNNIDLAYAEEKGIKVMNVAGYSTKTVVQVTFMMMLALVGKLAYFDGKVKSGDYSASGLFTDVSMPFSELDGKVLGIVGMGNIGSSVAGIARSFGMDVVYYSTSGTSHCTDYPSLSLDRLLESADVVSIHAPLNERTAGLIGERELRLMKRTAFLINVGRGGIVDEAALAAAVDAGVIAGAGVDVFVKEPLPADSPLMTISRKERLVLTPHIGWASAEARERLVSMMADNIASFIKFI